jgi:Tn3 transposase DDE domain/Peptidase family M13
MPRVLPRSGGVYRVEPDPKDSRKPILSISRRSLPLLDRETYGGDNSPYVVRRYEGHIVGVFIRAGDKFNQAVSEEGAVLGIEKALARASTNRAESADADKRYHVLSLAAGRVRVNDAVQNFEEFGKAFQCAKGNPIYPEKSCRVTTMNLLNNTPGDMRRRNRPLLRFEWVTAGCWRWNGQDGYREIFEAALSISTPWYIAGMSFEESQRKLMIRVDFELGSRYTGRVASYQAKSEDEMQAVADALSLLANIVMAWNTEKIQAIFDRWAKRRNGAIPPKLIARCAPTRTEGLNMRGIFRFPIRSVSSMSARAPASVARAASIPIPVNRRFRRHHHPAFRKWIAFLPCVEAQWNCIFGRHDR